jgi:methionyl aminopeptidase
MMNEFNVESYIKAGKAVIAAKKLAKELVKPGALFFEIAEKCEDEIIKHNCELSFPINMSLNEVAAHYSPPIKDNTIVPEKGLLKIDVGSHYNGFIADSAFTINLDGDSELQKIIDAADEGLKAAIKIFKPGTKLYELGEAIQKKINSFGFNPVRNLGGHELKRFNLHAGPFIPNVKDVQHNQELKPGVAYACEPFATPGDGWVNNGSSSYIFRLIKKLKKNVPYQELNYMNKIEQITHKLPFSPRILAKNKVIPTNQIERYLNTFLRKNVIMEYPILIEQTRKYVSQQEHTIIIDMDGNPIVTTQE